MNNTPQQQIKTFPSLLSRQVGDRVYTETTAPKHASEVMAHVGKASELTLHDVKEKFKVAVLTLPRVDYSYPMARNMPWQLAARQIIVKF